MSKAKTTGAALLIGAVMILVFYTIWIWGNYVHVQIDTADNVGDGSVLNWLAWIPDLGIPWELAVIIPLWLVTVFVLAIVIWIGCSMLITPPPVPLEDLERELEAAEEEGKFE
ncbi:MAG: hypothetical protein J7L53_06120 [Deltaproteobacteria bacterium]|nr:hypothetical protein [Deltaproteobacteria bacterium]